MNLARAPRSVIVVLAVLLVVSLASGIWLEFAQLELLTAHPYVSNLLSGLTGFSASAVAAVVALNLVYPKARLRQWGPTIVRNLQSAASTAEGIENALSGLLGAPGHDADLSSAHRDRRTRRELPPADVPGALGARATRIRELAVHLHEHPQVRDAELWNALLRRAGRLTDFVMPGMERAFERVDDPRILETWQEIENYLAILNPAGGRGSYQNPSQVRSAADMCETIADLLVAVVRNRAITQTYAAAAKELARSSATS